MEIVYFYDKDSKSCPVKKYLKQYLINNKDKESVIRRKQKILANIDAKILLHAFEKPSSYKTNKEKKMVDGQNKIGEKYLNIFKSNLFPVSLLRGANVTRHTI